MLSLRAQHAIDFALQMHLSQVDKVGRPYFGHVLRVALAVQHLGEDYFIAGLLHDVVEDCAVSLQEIEEHWGNSVSQVVDALSRRANETYMQFVKRCALNAIAREIKLADLADNMQPSRIQVLPLEQQGRMKRYNRAYAFLEKGNK